MSRGNQIKELTYANLSAEQMKSAIPKLRRRIKELEEFDPDSITARSDPRISSLDVKIEDTLAEIFGVETSEALRFRSTSLDQAGINFMHQTPVSDVIASVHKGKAREIANLNTVIEIFEEKLSDSNETPEIKAKNAISFIDFHPEIKRACVELFNDGHYANAVEDACKVLDALVKMRSMRSDLSGTDLMLQVFSPKGPILKFNKLESESEKSEQQGLMYLYAGTMLALRNPRAHGLIDDHPDRAVEYLSFINMLAKMLDIAVRE